MKTVILGGPSLALDTSIKTRHYSIIDLEDYTQVASIVVDTAARTRKLLIHRADQTEENTAAVCRLLKAVSVNSYEIPITADDGHAVSLAYLMSGNVASHDPDIVAAWTTLNFELELVNLQRDGSTNKIRFLGANIAGIKEISKASEVTFKITPKQK